MDEKNITTADSEATKEAQELLRELHCVAGKKIITGQHTQTIPCEEIDYIRQVTGKEPKLRGFELLAYSPNINYEDASPECIQEVEENKGTVDCNGPENSGKPEMVVFSPLPFTGSRLWKAETRASIPNTRILMQGKY